MNANCCNAQKWFGIMGMAVLLAGAYVLGTWNIGGSWDSAERSSPRSPQQLLADSATRGDTVSLATGQINAEFEGLFILDHVTGNIYCMMINPRTGVEIGTYTGNVRQQLNLGRQGDMDFAMVTGFIDLNDAGRSGNQRAANCICYVVEGNSGKAVGYGLNFNQTGLQKNVPQQGALIPLWQGAFRNQPLNPPNANPADANQAAPAGGAGNNNAAGNNNGGN